MLLPAFLIQGASTITYLSYLRNAEVVPLGLTAILGAAEALSAGVILIRRLRVRATRVGQRVAAGAQPSAAVSPRVVGGI